MFALQITPAAQEPAMPFPRPPLPPRPPLAWLLTGLLALSSAARADSGDLLTTEPLPAGIGHASGVAFDGAGVWVAELMVAGEPTSENKLLHFDADGGVDLVVPGGPGQVLQKLAWDGYHLWATRMYSELVRLDAAGAELEAFDVPFTQGLASDRTTGRLFLLEGQDSQAIHVVEQGVVTATVQTEQSHLYWWGLAWDGCSLWTVDRETDELLRIDADTGALLEARPAPTTRMAALDFDGAALLATDTATDLLLHVEVDALTYDSGAACEPALGEVAPPSSTPPAEEPAPEDEPAPAEPEEESSAPPSDVEDDADDEPGTTPEAPDSGEVGDEGTPDEEGGVEEGYFDSPDSPFQRPDPVSARGGCACARPPSTTFGGGAAALLCLGGLLLRRRRRRAR
jgi:hypothetical protein